jgi:hypothetical protein
VHRVGLLYRVLKTLYEVHNIPVRRLPASCRRRLLVDETFMDNCNTLDNSPKRAQNAEAELN